jgi:hypothetical protein
MLIEGVCLATPLATTEGVSRDLAPEVSSAYRSLLLLTLLLLLLQLLALVLALALLLLQLLV